MAKVHLLTCASNGRAASPPILASKVSFSVGVRCLLLDDQRSSFALFFCTYAFLFRMRKWRIVIVAKKVMLEK